DHQNYIPNGKLCSVGRANLAGMDLNRSDWLATKVSPGSLTFTWTNTAAHKTKYFRYYITKEGYNPNTQLDWDDLVLIHDSGAAGQENVSNHNVVLPNRTGRHIIYSIWQRDWTVDAAEGFYQCVDVDFGGGSSSTPSSSRSSSSSSIPVSSSSVASSSSSLSNNTCDGLPVWTESGVYTGKTYVQHSGKRYMANWYTQGQNPAQFSGQWEVWLDLGACVTSQSSSSVASSVASSSRSSVVSSSSRSSAQSSSVGGTCTSPVYVNGGSYATGALAQNVGNEYRCTVGGWCTVGGPYAPGVGWAWTNAWTLVKSCQ
ncbi:MAG: carbohydrate-binding protein, partial [Moraxellaceae bacterium]